jgi:hypothetical protein
MNNANPLDKGREELEDQREDNAEQGLESKLSLDLRHPWGKKEV